MDEQKRQPEPTIVEQSVARALRDSLPLVQHTATELSHAIEDFVAACTSRRTANTLPAMVRAESAAAALAAILESLTRIVTLASQAPEPTAAEARIIQVISAPAAEPAIPPDLPRRIPVPMAEAAPSPAPLPVQVDEPPSAAVMREAARAVEEARFPKPVAEFTPVDEPRAVESTRTEVVELSGAESAAEEAPAAEPVAVETPGTEAAAAFLVENLPVEQQELHRRANRVAKVSMQDIRMLRPKDVQLGQEHRDLCVRLRNDLDKARKEYVRRFQPILEHPVDYFHHWMVEILAEGNPDALGEYPYPSPLARR